MEQLQNSIQSYGNSSDGIQAYKQMADSEFFADWRDKVDSANKILDTVSKSLEGAGGAVGATKILGTVGKWASKKLIGGGADAVAEATTKLQSMTAQATRAISRLNGNVTGNSDTGASASIAGDAGSGATVTPVTGPTTAPQVTAGDAGGGGGTGAQGPTSQGLGSRPSPNAQQLGRPQSSRLTRSNNNNLADDDDDTPFSLQTPRTLTQSTGGPARTTTTTTTAPDADDVSEGPTLEGAPDSVLDKIASGVVDDEGAGMLGDIGAVAGTAMDFLGPIGLLAGIGMSIYEAVHKTPKPPPPVLTGQIQAQKSAMVLPTYDSVQDTPASSSAF